PAQAELANLLTALGRDPHVIGIAQLIGAVTGLAVGVEPLAVPRKDLDAMIAGVGDIKVVARAEADALRAVELAVLIAGDAETKESSAVAGGEPLNAVDGGVFAEKDLAEGIDRNGAREDQFAAVGGGAAPLFDEGAIRGE